MHQPRPLKEKPHEDKERDRRQDLLVHQPNSLEIHQGEDDVAKPEEAEGHGQDDEGESDGETDEDAQDEGSQHHQAGSFTAHSHLPRQTAYTLFRNSDTPWSSNRPVPTGMANLKG